MSLSVSCRRAVKIEVPADGERQQRRDGGHDHLPACDGGDGGLRTAGHPARIRVPLQALEVRANVGRVLVAQLPVCLQALRDDALQRRATARHGAGPRPSDAFPSPFHRAQDPTPRGRRGDRSFHREPARAPYTPRCQGPCPACVAVTVSVGASSSCARGLCILARPKSRIFAWPRLLTKMLAGLMSR